MQLTGSIKAVNLLIRDFASSDYNRYALSRAAQLAKSKLTAKFEEPERESCTRRRTDAWFRWISFDEGLQPKFPLGPHWAKARLLVHEILSNFRMGDLVFTNGSSFEPLRDRTSVACKLTGAWSITDDCFDVFAKYSYWHRALKFATKKRFKRYCTVKGWDMKSVNRKLWNRFKNVSEPAFQIYKFKLHCTVSFVHGNRWSTVPKNNSKDRSICLEPLCNMLVQRAVGLGIRNCLKDNIGIDLDILAEKHRNRISDKTIATIDLSDCSDAISVRLIKYLLPKRVLNKVLASRSEMTLGPDNNFYVVKKVSSMGNGFTFDLMTLILTALTRSFDATATVFGDDIICRNDCAEAVVENLSIAGFVVNLDKTNINSDYRESCGAHYIDEYGYVTVFDLRWLQTPHDLVVACNKVAILSCVYGEPFDSLLREIWTCVPQTLLGATVVRPTVYTGRPPSYNLDTYIRYGPIVKFDPPRRLLRLLRGKLKDLQKQGNISIARAFVNYQLPAKDQLKSTEWDVFFQYIRSSRRSRKVPRLVSKSILVARVGEEQIGFASALLP